MGMALEEWKGRELGTGGGGLVEQNTYIGEGRVSDM